MQCIIVDDEPIARKGIKRLVDEIAPLELLDSFNNTESASLFFERHKG